MTEQEKRALARALDPVVRRVRTDVTAVKAHGRQSWTNEALTEPRLMLHVNGAGPARGCCPIKAGESVTMLALFDLDSHKGEISWPDMAECAATISDAAQLFGLEAIPFRSSGGNGIHLIFLWDEPQDARSVRQMLKGVLESVNLRDGTGGLIDGQVEIFPKQDSVPVGGWGNQFVLPLAGKSEPLLPMMDYEPAGKDYALSMDWPVSEPVPFIERVQREQTRNSEDVVGLDTLRSALGGIPNEGAHELDYDEWRNVIFGIHAETGGSEDGLTLAHEFSARSSKYDPDFLDNRVWPHIRDRDGGISGRTIVAMARQFGWREDISGMFEVISIEVSDEPGTEVGEVLPAFRRNRQGEIIADLDNLVQAFGSFPAAGCHIAWDDFRGSVVTTDDPAGLTGWRPVEDHDAVAIRLRLERIGFKPIGRELMRDVLKLQAQIKKFDSAIMWAKKLVWDGVPRIDRFLTNYMGVEENDYAVAGSRYLWSAMAGRCLVPGIKADIALVLISRQGAGKSTGVAAMSPLVEWFCELDLAAKDDEKARILRGKLIAEFGELRGMYAKEVEHVKAFMSRPFEEWVPKFVEFAIRYYRRAVFIGTSNEDEFLTDKTGNRRWAPFRTGKIDVEAIRRDCLQLWAEAVQLFEREGIQYEALERMATEMHDQHMVEDPWDTTISAWLHQTNDDGVKNGNRSLKVNDVLAGALLMGQQQMDRKAMLRAAGVLKGLGFTKRHGRAGKLWENSDFA